MDVNVPSSLLKVYAPRNKPFHEWISSTRLFKGFFAGNYGVDDIDTNQDFELSLDDQIMALMIFNRQAYNEILLIPSDFRVEVLKTLRKIKGSNGNNLFNDSDF